MRRRIRKFNADRPQVRGDSVRPHQAADDDSTSGRMIVLHALTDLARSGLGVLEEIPGLGPQVFSLHSGEVFWLGTDEITRIK